MYQDTSKNAFDELTGTGVRETLRDLVFAAVCDIGPVHNLRLLEHLQQKEKLRPKKYRIVWTTNNCWPRVTRLVAMGVLRDMGAYRGLWYDKKKTLHFWVTSGQSVNGIPSGWVKVEKKSEPLYLGVAPGAKQKSLF